MTESPAPDLVALVGSRIAHDLISPLGAIGNGLELLGLTGLDTSPEFALIRESLDNANARIRAFRIAFGAARPGQNVAESEIRALLEAGGDGRKLEIDWQVAGDPPRDAVKLAFLLLMCFENAMPWGGRITVRAEDGEWHLTGVAERLRIEPALWHRLTDPAPLIDIVPARVHFALAGREAAAQGRPLAVTIDETSIAIRYG